MTLWTLSDCEERLSQHRVYPAAFMQGLRESAARNPKDSIERAKYALFVKAARKLWPGVEIHDL